MAELSSSGDRPTEADFVAAMRRAQLQVPESLYAGTLAGFRDISAHLVLLREMMPGIGDPFYAHRFPDREGDHNDAVA
ncbi:MAG TPA: hypothetical protein VFX60_17590 [Micromonospora sp.]|nr:hypothetical protein [Micromonospora sp.]